MKNIKYIQKLILSGVLMLMLSGLYAQTFTSTPNLPITDVACNINGGDGQGPDSDILVVGGLGTPLDGATVTLDSVCLNISHTWIGDLQVSLLAPDGVTRITLVSTIGETIGNPTGLGSNGDDIDICLHAAGTNGTTDVDDNPLGSMCNGANPPCLIGSWIPTEPLVLQENGQDPNGNWTLEICDSAAADTGILNSWSLNFTDNSAPPPPIPTMGQWGIIILGLMMVIIGLVAAFSWHRKTKMAG
jgi:hypothetical protein